MKILLIVMGLIFIIPFFAGIILASIKGNNRRRRAYAIVFLASLPPELVTKMKNMWLAYKTNHVLEVNRITSSINPDLLEDLLDSISPENRPSQFSSGEQGDNVFWLTMMQELSKQGYSVDTQKVIAGIVLHELDRVL